MSILMEVGVGIGAVILLLASVCVTLETLLPTKKIKGEEMAITEGYAWDESIEDV